MKRTVEIVIKAGTGDGKTTLGFMIADGLRNLGFEAELDDTRIDINGVKISDTDIDLNKKNAISNKDMALRLIALKDKVQIKVRTEAVCYERNDNA